MLFVIIQKIHLLVLVQVVFLVMHQLNVKTAQLLITVTDRVVYMVDRSLLIQSNLAVI